MSEFYLEPTKEQQVRNEAVAAAQAIAAEDLRTVVQNQAGFRFIQGILNDLGAARPLDPDPVCVDRRQFAENLLDAIAVVEPHACLRLLAGLRGIPVNLLS